MTISDVRPAASLPQLGRRDAVPPIRVAANAAPFGPAVTLSLSADAATLPDDLESLRDFKDVASAAKLDIADAARRLQTADPQDVAASEQARVALDRELAELSDVVVDGVRASDGADLLAASIGADAIARPLVLNIVV